MQLYHYAGNNPVRYVDPDGRADSIRLLHRAGDENGLFLQAPENYLSLLDIDLTFSVPLKEETKITSRYGIETDPLNEGKMRMHLGVDIGSFRSLDQEVHIIVLLRSK